MADGSLKYLDIVSLYSTLIISIHLPPNPRPSKLFLAPQLVHL